MNEKEKGKKMAYDKVKIRKFWDINPAEKAHGSPKGEKGYNRKSNKQEIENALNEWEEDLESESEV